MPVQPNRPAGAAPPAADAAWRHGGNVALIAVAAAWLALLAAIIVHPIFVTNDSLSDYIHVWYIADRIWGGHGIPLHMPVIGHGQAFAFPYAFIPWLSAALLRPLLGDWVVTLWLVLGAAGVIAGTWWAFPELRRGWWAALLLLNPMLIEGPLLGQLPFLWAAAMLFAAVALWRGERRLLAALALGAAQATHAPVLLPIAGILVLARLPWEPRRLALCAAYVLSLAIAAPAAWLALASPVVQDATTRTLIANFLGTVSLRAIVVAAPFVALFLRPRASGAAPAALFGLLVALNLLLVPVRHDQFGWGALLRTPDHSLDVFIRTPRFQPDATYRILRVADGKVGMYDLLRAGARLDSEPFPESIDRRSWPTITAYVAFLRERLVDYVIIYDAYDRDFHTNEHHLLEEMADAADARPCVTVQFRGSGFDVYRIHREQC